MKNDGKFYFSKNFTTSKTITNGAIRTSFVLKYANWDTAGNTIEEEKHTSLDYDSNLTRNEVSLKGADKIAEGLTLHENDGVTNINIELLATT